MKFPWIKRKEADLDAFIVSILKLKPEEFLGLVTLMNIDMLDADRMPKTGDELIVEVCANFMARAEQQKVKLIKFINKTTKFSSLPSFTPQDEENQKKYEEWRENELRKLAVAKKSSPEDVTDGTTTEDKS